MKKLSRSLVIAYNSSHQLEYLTILIRATIFSKAIYTNTYIQYLIMIGKIGFCCIIQLETTIINLSEAQINSKKEIQTTLAPFILFLGIYCFEIHTKKTLLIFQFTFLLPWESYFTNVARNLYLNLSRGCIFFPILWSLLSSLDLNVFIFTLNVHTIYNFSFYINFPIAKQCIS